MRSFYKDGNESNKGTRERVKSVGNRSGRNIRCRKTPAIVKRINVIFSFLFLTKMYF